MNAKTENPNISLMLLFLLMVLMISCVSKAQISNSSTGDFTVSSSAFKDQGNYPKLYTCDSLSYSPTISFENIPKTAKTIAVVMSHIAKDGDEHVYWIVYNIPINTLQIPENTSNIGWFGHNTMNKNLAYSSPCSKGPGEKKYIITAYAISKNLEKKGLSKNTLMNLIKNAIIAKSEMNVKYSR